MRENEGEKGYSVRNKIFVVDCRILPLSLMEKIHASLEMRKFGRKTMRSQNTLVFFSSFIFTLYPAERKKWLSAHPWEEN